MGGGCHVSGRAGRLVPAGQMQGKQLGSSSQVALGGAGQEWKQGGD